ncbi:ankyrin repeat-containing domain protein [Nemania sp. FL0031]|nr:ankyrin repeat-containing domain protein [Nemania sp. FL0031]
MSNFQQDLNDKFKELASCFRTLNICQKGQSPSHDVIIEESCAQIGVDTEITVALERSHYQLGILLEHEQQEFIENILRNETTRRWKFYQNFFTTLQIDQYKSPNFSKAGMQSQGELLRRFFSDDDVKEWQNQSPSSILRLTLTETQGFEFEAFCYSISDRLVTLERGEPNLFLHLGRDRPCQSPSTVQQLCASLCLQLLEQQPSLIMWIRHLYPNVRDAILGGDNTWKSRALRRCLRTLLLVPKREVTYCLIHYAPDSNRNCVMDQILTLMEQSEIPFRLLVVASPNTQTGFDVLDTCPRANLLSINDRETSGNEGENSLRDQSQGHSTELRVKTATSYNSDVNDHTKEPESGRKLKILEHALSRCINSDSMAWVIDAVAWVAYAIKPLSRVGIEQALEIVCTESSIPIGMHNGKLLLRAIELALPGSLIITQDAVWAIPQLESKLSELWAKNSRDSPSSELKLARTCFNLTAVHFRNFTQAATPTLAVDHEAVGAINLSSKNHQAILEYATKYWLEHQFRSTRGTNTADESFRQTLELNKEFDRDAWIRHLTSQRWSPKIGNELRAKIMPSFLQETYKLDQFKACYISFCMATRFLEAEDNFEQNFLDVAREHILYSTYLDLIFNVIGLSPSKPRWSGTLQRIVASVPPSLLDQILAKAGRDNFLLGDFVVILLTTIAIGNYSATTALLKVASDYDLGPKHENFGLGTALQVACEYGDSAVVKSILNFSANPSPLSLGESHYWNALHVACQQGHVSIAEDLIENMLSKSSDQAIDTNSPSQFSPLLVTSSRGLFSLTKALKRLRFSMPVGEKQANLPLQLASKYGFSKTLKSLFDDHILQIVLESHDDFALFSALKSGNQGVGLAVYEKFIEVVREAVNVSRIVRNLRNPSALRDDKKRTPLMVSAMMGSVELVKKFVVKGSDITDNDSQMAMYYACRYGHFDVVKVLLDQDMSVGAKALNYGSETPLRVAAMGSHPRVVSLLISRLSSEDLRIEFILAAKYGLEATMDLILTAATDTYLVDRKSFINEKDESGNTPLHYASMSNHVRAVQFLLLRGANLEAVNKTTMTPLALAMRQSSLDSMKLLLDAGASTQILVGREMSILSCAIHRQNATAVQMLLKYGAKLQLPDCWSYISSLLHFTLLESYDGVLEVVLEHYDRIGALVLEIPPEEIPTPTEALSLIIKEGRPSSFDTLAQIWDKFEPVMREGDFVVGSILKYAARYGSGEMLVRILEYSKEKKTDINEIGGYHGTALQAAIVSQKDSTRKVKELIKWGAELVPRRNRDDEDEEAGTLNTPSLNGYWGTVLHAAAFEADERITTLILHLRDDLKDEPDMMGRLPLHLAMLGKSWKLVRQLSSSESTIGAEDRQGRNSLHVACSSGNVALVEQMFENTDIAYELINKPDKDGWTPLHWAYRARNPELIKTLIKKGAGIENRAISPAGWLPFHVAIFHGWAHEMLSNIQPNNTSTGSYIIERGRNTHKKCDCCHCVSLIFVLGIDYHIC